MFIDEYHLAELKHAYQILDIPLSAAPLSIKHSYRRIAKRWHPDLYPSGTTAYAEATQMMKLINEAYAQIQNAPLRYHVEGSPAGQRRSKPGARASAEPPQTVDSNTLPRTDRTEFWARFTWGAFFGILACLRLWMQFFDLPAIMLVLASIGLIVGLGLAATRIGDELWQSLFQSWLRWE